MIQVEIDANGGLAMLHDDAVDLSAFGEIEVSRASHVEYSDGRLVTDVEGRPVWVEKRGWFVASALSLEVLSSGFPTRAAALAWEKSFYSPSGAGWAELNGGK